MNENNNTQTTPRLSRKIFVVGKIYDTALMTDQEIGDAVQEDLDDYIGSGKVNFSIHTDSNMISLIFIRFTDYYKQNNIDLSKDMIDADAFMVTGEDYNGFLLPYKFPIAPFGYSPYTLGQSDFKMAYKESAELLGADKVRWMKMKSDISLNEKQRTSSVLLHDFRLVLKQNAVMFLLGFVIFCVLFPVSTCAVPDTSVFNVDYTHQQLKFRFCADEVVPLMQAAAVLFGVAISAINNPKNLIKMGVELIVVVIVVGAVYFLSSGAPAQGYIGPEVSQMTLKLTDTVLNLTYILCALTVLAIIGGGIYNAIRNK